MAVGTETFEQRLKAAMDLSKAIEDRDTRELLQRRAMLDVINREILDIEIKYQKLIDVRRALENLVADIKAEADTDTAIAEEFEKENDKLQAMKNNIYAEIFQLKSQEHTRGAVRKGDTFLEKHGKWE